MRWSLATRHKILLEITNAVISKTSNQAFFNTLFTELNRHIPCDRLSINLYDEKSQSLKYFTAAGGIDPVGLSGMDRRPLMKGPIAKMAIQSRQPIIIDDLSRYKDSFTIAQLVNAGLRSTMAFPLIVREVVLGTLHCSFKTIPAHISELSELLAEVSNQVAIAVDNFIAYSRLRDENQHLEREKHYLIGTSEDYQLENFIYASTAMAEIIRMARLVAELDTPVLITGETGTGKDFLARYIHHISPRRDHLFVKINCPTIPHTLFESELFGHAKGAFTGANAARMGRFEMADKGTVFLDEVGELPASMQAKLLQVLQERCFERIGDNRLIHANFRVIAATNRNPEESIDNGRLRKDLYYRLNIFRLHLPPLRQRHEDIPLLVTRINQREAALINRPAPHYSDQALDRLNAYQWPGNVRELKNLVRRMIILKPGRKVRLTDVEKMVDTLSLKQGADPSRLLTLAESECRTIETALKRCHGVIGGQHGAARRLGVPRSTLNYRIKKYGINAKGFVRPGLPG